MAVNREEEQDGQTHAIISRLITLPDADLSRILPEFNPASVRQNLQTLLKKLPAPAAPAEKPPAQTDATPPSAEKGMDTLYLYTDGASRGNPGDGGAGVALLDDQGREIFGQGYYLGQCTNNEAEYKALILGLTEAAKIGCRKLVISLDSQLIVRQIQGAYKVKAPALKPLFDQVSRLLQNFTGYSVRHVPRAENSRADKLANQGIDEAGMA